MAPKVGISEKTLRTAKKKLGVKSEKSATGPWSWRLDEDGESGEVGQANPLGMGRRPRTEVGRLLPEAGVTGPVREDVDAFLEQAKATFPNSYEIAGAQ